MKNKVIAVSIADANNMQYFEKMKNSLRKFHTEEELPLALIGPEQLKENPDPQLFYRATPILGKQFFDLGYDTVIKLDADQVITGKLNHIWEGDFDVAVVQNSNPREAKLFPVSVWDIVPAVYVNCGLVVMKSKKFVQNWMNLCFSPHFNNYQMREQDLLNILVYYGGYNVKMLDNSNKWHGLIHKGYWIDMKLKDDKLILPKNEEWPTDEDKEIVCIHWAGGNTPNKMNFNTAFKEDVAKWLNKLTK